MTRPYAALVDRIAGKGAAGWAVHFAARQAEARGEDVVILSVGDPDHDTPTGIIDAAAAAMRAGDTHYAPIAGKYGLRDSIVEHLNRRAGVDYAPDEVIAAVGTQGALFSACLCLLDPGDEVIVFDPAYLTYEASIQAPGGVVVAVPPLAGFRANTEGLAAAITPKTKAILFNSPANPSGVVATEQETRAVAAVAIEHDLWVLSDEVYADLVFSGLHTPMASVEGMKERTVTLGSVSKSHAMTGWRSGWAAGPREFIEHMDRLSLAATYGLPGFIQQATAVALREHQEDVERMRQDYIRRRDLATSLLADTPIEVLAPQAGMFVLADVRAVNSSSHDFAWDLFRSTGVSVLDAAAFGPSADGWVRISFTLSDADLAEGCRRIASFCATQAPTME